MAKSFKIIEGRAFEILKEVKQLQDDTNNLHSQLQKQMEEFSEGAKAKAMRLESELKELLGIKPGACCHIDTDYAAEHGMFFVRTGCSDHDGSSESSEMKHPLAKLLAMARGTMN